MRCQCNRTLYRFDSTIRWWFNAKNLSAIIRRSYCSTGLLQSDEYGSSWSEYIRWSCYLFLALAKTYDGRFVDWSFFFFVENNIYLLCLGTTDTPCEITDYPSPSTEDVEFILGEVKNYLSSDVQVRRGDVLAAWSGIRPLVVNPNKKDTQSIARNHIIHVSDSGLVTIGGRVKINFQ